MVNGRKLGEGRNVQKVKRRLCEQCGKPLSESNRTGICWSHQGFAFFKGSRALRGNTSARGVNKAERRYNG